MSVPGPLDHAKLLADPAARAARRELLREPHVAPLTAFVEALRAQAGQAVSIPDFDPLDGGTAAEVLYLLEAPGSKAVLSGFVSRNNPDETAKNFFELNQIAGIPRERSVVWNIVPWYIGTATRIRAAKRSDVDAGLRSLAPLVSLLPRLRAVVLVGKKADTAALALTRLRPDVRIFRSPHPSPMFVNNAPGNRDRILSILREVARYLSIGDPAV